MSTTFYWYDLETYGLSPRAARPVQFAGQRTTGDLEPIGEPDVFFCELAADVLPEVEACLLHGMTPASVAGKALRENDFAREVSARLAQPGTCVVGFNAMRFDHVVLHHLFWRNLLDPYGWHWRNGNRRWDVIDLARAAAALRPEGVVWPSDGDGCPTFRLAALAEANGIVPGRAHDALADVRATIELARRIRAAQPRLFAHALALTDRSRARRLAAEPLLRPVAHTTAMFAAEVGHTSLVLPLTFHPAMADAVIALDLRPDPGPFLRLPLQELRSRLFTPAADLPVDAMRPALKLIHLGRAPFLAPARLLDQEVAARIGLDLQACGHHARTVLEMPDFLERARDAYGGGSRQWQETDVDVALYPGGLPEDVDRGSLEAWLRHLHDRPGPTPSFRDNRLGELAFRYRARNHPETLGLEEATRWREQVRRRLLDPGPTGFSALAAFRQELAERAGAGDLDCRGRQVLRELSAHADGIEATFSTMGS